MSSCFPVAMSFLHTRIQYMHRSRLFFFFIQLDSRARWDKVQVCSAYSMLLSLQLACPFSEQIYIVTPHHNNQIERSKKMNEAHATVLTPAWKSDVLLVI